MTFSFHKYVSGIILKVGDCEKLHNKNIQLQNIEFYTVNDDKL